MATLTKVRSRVAYTISGNSPEIRELVESAGKSHKAGCVMFPSASGRMTPVGTGAVGRADVGRGVMAIALKDGGSYTNSTTKVPMLIINDDTVFLANIVSRFSTATATLAQQIVGSLCGASMTNSGMYVSWRLVGATGSMCVVRGIFEDDAIGDSFGRVYFQFLRANRANR